jgi:hypothetical protein
MHRILFLDTVADTFDSDSNDDSLISVGGLPLGGDEDFSSAGVAPLTKGKSLSRKKRESLRMPVTSTPVRDLIFYIASG